MEVLRVWGGGASPVAQLVKNLSADARNVKDTLVRSPGREDALEKEMATCSSILDWRIIWTGEPAEPLFMRSQRVGHDVATEHTHTRLV